MASELHPSVADLTSRRRDEYETLSEAERLSLINPFDARPQPVPALFDRAEFLTVNGSPAGPVDNLNPLGLRQRPPQHYSYLEMEDPPMMEPHLNPPNRLYGGDQDLLGIGQEPSRTSSGLLLTHRQPVPRVPPQVAQHDNDDKKRHASMRINGSLETDWGYATSSRDPYAHKDPTSAMLLTARRLLSFARVYIVLFVVVLTIGTLSIVHSSTHERNADTASQIVMSREKQLDSTHLPLQAEAAATEATEEEPIQIILVPIENVSQLKEMQLEEPPKLSITHHNSKHHGSHHPDGFVDGATRALKTLRDEFEEWIEEHEKSYASHEEKEDRFHIWSQNHHETHKKNQRHGPCKLTKQNVFGSNLFKDLSPEEFKSRYLTGYKGPKTDELEMPMQQLKVGTKSRVHKITPGSGMVFDVENRGDWRTAAQRHPDVQKRYLEHVKASEMGKKYIEHWDHPNRNQSNYTFSSLMGKKYIEHWDHPNRNQSNYSWYPDSVVLATLTLREKAYYEEKLKAFYDNLSCNWYDVSCWLRYVVDNYGYFVGIGTMEPAYDSESYPSSVDWRAVGAVTSVHSQGSCGACWAITAVETVESAYFIATGLLYELSEAEVIACEESCEMCNGGWPQNAYEYVMKNKGLPTEKELYYNADFLLAMTYVNSGESSDYGTDYLANYLASTCPNGNNNNKNGKTRYGNIKGYGYATDRCVCYTDGSGCSCDKQDESLAIANVATYGPATVCLEASLWQDYSGGIITSELGCSSAFVDMNHCVQAVGYAFVETDGSDSNNGDKNNEDKNKQKNKNTYREGYWIIRNQWSSSWGMQGYAYVAMGANTCGVLNDMTLVYM